MGFTSTNGTIWSTNAEKKIEGMNEGVAKEKRTRDEREQERKKINMNGMQLAHIKAKIHVSYLRGRDKKKIIRAVCDLKIYVRSTFIL